MLIKASPSSAHASQPRYRIPRRHGLRRLVAARIRVTAHTSGQMPLPGSEQVARMRRLNRVQPRPEQMGAHAFAEYAWPKEVQASKPVELRIRLGRLLPKRLSGMGPGREAEKGRPMMALRAPLSST